MRISAKKKQELYKEFSEPITKMRIEINEREFVRSIVIDDKLFHLEQKIWKNIASILGIDNP